MGSGWMLEPESEGALHTVGLLDCWMMYVYWSTPAGSRIGNRFVMTNKQYDTGFRYVFRGRRMYYIILYVLVLFFWVCMQVICVRPRFDESPINMSSVCLF